ncbi:MAG: hypothetical protein JGK29_28005 [Microcoleus sp. PH2017_17_BER_D_A]|nr:hypothetical protein [Microcoleus sp. PH2017_17_BER_D_A]
MRNGRNLIQKNLDDLRWIERSISSLSIEEQLWLLERIACRVREKTYIANKLANAKYLEAEIAEMANDPDIQVEIAAINQEFLVAEMDGLEAL